MISHTSSAQNRMKLRTLHPYVNPQDYFLENSEFSKNLSQKTRSSVNLDLEKFAHVHQSFGTRFHIFPVLRSE